MDFNFNPGNINTSIIISYNIVIILYYLINYYFIRLYTYSCTVSINHEVHFMQFIGNENILMLK